MAIRVRGPGLLPISRCTAHAGESCRFKAGKYKKRSLPIPSSAQRGQCVGAGIECQVQFRELLACAILMDPTTIKETHVPVSHILSIYVVWGGNN